MRPEQNNMEQVTMLYDAFVWFDVVFHSLSARESYLPEDKKWVFPKPRTQNELLILWQGVGVYLEGI